MRIIAGKYGGRKLVAFKASHLRPTTDRVKEVIFNKLQFDIEDANVLDLFSGTGNLSFEALSRGAKFVVAVEKNPKSVEIIKKNQQLLSVSKESFQLIHQDVFKFLKSESRTFDIILIDPPFTQSIGDEVMSSLSESQVFKNGTRVFIETTKHEECKDSYGNFDLIDRKNYGDKFLSIFQACIPEA